MGWLSAFKTVSGLLSPEMWSKIFGVFKLFGAYLKGRSDAKKAAKMANQQMRLDHAELARDKRQTVRQLSDDDLDEELKQWAVD